MFVYLKKNKKFIFLKCKSIKEMANSKILAWRKKTKFEQRLKKKIEEKKKNYK